MGWLGIIHSYDKDHRLDNEVGYTEEEPPSYDGNVYVRLRIAQEKTGRGNFSRKMSDATSSVPNFVGYASWVLLIKVTEIPENIRFTNVNDCA